MVRVEKNCCEAQNVKCTKCVTDMKIDLANAKEAWCGLERRASTDRSAMGSTT